MPVRDYLDGPGRQFGRKQDGETSPGKSADTDYMQLCRDRYQASKSGWSVIREDFRQDLRYRSGDPADQWETSIKDAREDGGIPTLTMDRLNPLVNQIVNDAAKDRPQPKVGPADGGNPDTADVLEGKMRHVMYESHADIAFNCSALYCASGGFGFHRIVKEWIGKKFIQEPRVKRIPDPLTVLFDPDVQELDYSDARWCFVQKKYDRDEFKREFHKEPVPFPVDDQTAYMNDWSDERKVLVCEYWWVENKPVTLLQLSDGRSGTAEDLGEFDDAEVSNSRDRVERIVHCDIVDGEKKLEESVHEGEWIPIIPVIAQEVISDGQRRYVSVIRYSRDPQTMINATMSKTMTAISTINEAPFIGWKGQFKDVKWRDGKRHFYMEAEPTTIGGQPAPLPQRNAFEPAIQGSTAATAQSIDALKGAVGYVDSVTQPSQNDLSGVAVERRDKQANLANMQYKDSLTQSMWHTGRVILDLLQSLTDTPRTWQNRREDGTQKPVHVTMAVPDGTNPYVPGKETEPHVKIDDGDYGVTIYAGPSYDTKNDEEADFLTRLIESDPALAQIYLPAIFRRRGMQDLEEVATAAMPPAIQQALAAKQGGAQNPAMLAQQAQQLQQQNQHLQGILQQVMQKLQTKQIETEGKLTVQNAKTQGDLAIERMKTIRALLESLTDNAHDATKHLSDKHHDATKHMLDMFHASELPVQSASLAPEPQPQGAPQ